MQIKSAKDLEVYKKAYKFAMKIFELTKQWPLEEKFSLVNQIRRASRSVCTNLREAWAKRRYEDHQSLSEECREIGSMLGAMLNNPKPFLSRSFEVP